MKFSTFETIDPFLLPGLINTALRNDCENLGDFELTHDIDHEKLERRMKEIGYYYIPEINQFRPISKV